MAAAYAQLETEHEKMFLLLFNKDFSVPSFLFLTFHIFKLRLSGYF